MAIMYVEQLPLPYPLNGDSIYPDGPELIIDLATYEVVPADFQGNIVLTIFNDYDYDVNIKFRQLYSTNDSDYGEWETIPADLVATTITIAPNPAASDFIGIVLYSGDSLWDKSIITIIDVGLGGDIFWTNHNNQTEYL